jgi:Flp pilus assembly pilin Flp
VKTLQYLFLVAVIGVTAANFGGPVGAAINSLFSDIAATMDAANHVARSVR